ncbi:unnamed protein product [Prunus armeniaca]|uniref:Uncharacterized protein n=1 Tax=Prunus armeniaca TaxID=36596 RepID=A0A6J5XHN9_PRUAR|nr:unnamed protein product [Prunus armeniaca]CAB4312087.1 unnamed protein product [Prunus armeniaca]
MRERKREETEREREREGCDEGKRFEEKRTGLEGITANSLFKSQLKVRAKPLQVAANIKKRNSTGNLEHVLYHKMLNLHNFSNHIFNFSKPSDIDPANPNFAQGSKKLCAVSTFNDIMSPAKFNNILEDEAACGYLSNGGEGE